MPVHRMNHASPVANLPYQCFLDLDPACPSPPSPPFTTMVPPLALPIIKASGSVRTKAPCARAALAGTSALAATPPVMPSSSAIAAIAAIGRSSSPRPSAQSTRQASYSPSTVTLARTPSIGASSMEDDYSPLSTPTDPSAKSESRGRGRGMARKASVVRGSEPARESDPEPFSSVRQAVPIKAVSISPTHHSHSSKASMSQVLSTRPLTPSNNHTGFASGQEPLSRLPSPPHENELSVGDHVDLFDFDMDLNKNQTPDPIPPRILRPRARTFLPPPTSTISPPPSVVRKFSTPTLRPMYGPKANRTPDALPFIPPVRKPHIPIPPSHRESTDLPIAAMFDSVERPHNRRGRSKQPKSLSRQDHVEGGGIPIPGPRIHRNGHPTGHW